MMMESKTKRDFSITWPGERPGLKGINTLRRVGGRGEKRPATMATGVACARKLGAWCGPNGAKETAFSAALDQGPHRPLHMLEPVEKLRRRACRDPLLAPSHSLVLRPIMIEEKTKKSKWHLIELYKLGTYLGAAILVPHLHPC